MAGNEHSAELLDLVRQEWSAWDARIAGLSTEIVSRPTNAAGWTIKDINAHLTWFERETIELIRSREFGGSELWLLGAKERNAAILLESRERSLDDVRRESATTRILLLAALATLNDDDLRDHRRFPPMPGEFTPLQIIEDNTWIHYEAHRERLEPWLIEQRRATNPSE